MSVFRERDEMGNKAKGYKLIFKMHSVAVIKSVASNHSTVKIAGFRRA